MNILPHRNSASVEIVSGTRLRFRLLLFMALAIFLTEFFISVVFDEGFRLFLASEEAVLRALLLIWALFPLLYLLVFRPLWLLQFLERKRVDEELETVSSQLRNLFENLDEVFFSKDMIQEEVLLISPSCEKVYGLRQDAFYKNSMLWKEVIYPDDVHIIDESSPLLLRGETVHNEYRIFHKNGEIRWVRSHVKPTLDGKGNLIRLDGLTADITEHKRAEDERDKIQKLESLGVLAGGIAHDFNNILTAVLGNVSFAKLSINPQSRTYALIDEAEKASLRAKELARQLLTFSKGGEPVKTIVSMTQLVHDAACFALHGSRIRCVCSIPEELWLCNVDEGQIAQVVQNIVLNAEQAMPEGGRISVWCENVQVQGDDMAPLKDGDYVCVSVQDEGGGIPPEHLKRIFEPYFTTKKKGSGLGLATSYSIVKKHGGHIFVESESGRGSAFHVYLPACKEPPAKPTKKEKVLPVGKGRILVMDDEAPIRMLLEGMLEFLGYEASYAKDGQEALNLYREERESGKPFDAVLLDLTIPGGMGGKETMERLLEINPSVKAIVSSGYSDDPVMANYKHYGFKAVVPKPYDLKKMGDVLHDVMRVNGRRK